jgi:hypothetical protein
VLFPFTKDLFEGLGLDAAAGFDVDIKVFIAVDGEAFGFPLISRLGGHSLVAGGVGNSDTSLPDRIFQTCPLVENDPTVTTKVDSDFSILSHNPLPSDIVSLIRKMGE